MRQIEEEWRDIPGMEGRYQVSNFGRVRSLDQEWLQKSRLGKLHSHKKKGKVLRPGRMSSGHLSVSLGKTLGSRTVHSLVMLAFVGPPPDGMEICHGDGDPANNHLSNLRYDTRAENCMDEYRLNRSHRAKLTDDQIREIRKKADEGARTIDLAAQYGVLPTTISAVRHKKTYRWVE